MALDHITKSEWLALAMDLEHAPSCEWSDGGQFFFRDQSGQQWKDSACTIPYVSPECSCGYFALLRSAQAKARALAETL